ncbi:RagB/SusD family nutrient uptake outer membrane protein [Pontibacter sp. 172403-2]|uniref:RagB/SusD family nutrient uptake outer membrane protein n=1 Tax=Pontibacter rufus TaxID=2791028 RepID=UPI0018AF8E68|nr:RagB/SusD family nutrient uptake outer membrane protein [Pontibacter sp. 172403-2]MBF9255709.1 RagB/SusD family nutrient uptake outer membrane protein [Pontibacter sp. 172403-2]
MKKKYILSILLSAFLLGSCEDDFLDRAPLDQITDENFWQTEEQLELAVDAMYGYLKAKNTVDMAIMGDNTYWPSNNNFKQIGSGNFSYDLSTINNEWTGLYTGIRQANTFLANYKNAAVQDPEKAEELAAQVRVIRAYLYSYLTAFFGDVPLVTEPLGIDELYGPRDPREEVVDFMLAELDMAAEHLPAEIPTGDDAGRLNKGAALALKARIALYNERWEVAEEAAKAVMDMGIYELFDVGDPSSNYRRLFTYEGKLSGGNNRETIISRLHLEGVSDHNLSREIQVPDQGVRWNPTKSLVDDYLMSDGLPIEKSPLYSVNTYNEVFENRDPRMTQTILEPGSPWGGRYDSSPEHKDADPSNDHPDIFVVPKFSSDKRGAATYTGYYFTKYVEPSTVGQVSKDVNDIHLLRYAEVLLTYAEARLEQGELTQEDVDMTINKLRDRVGMKHMDLAELTANGLDIREEVRRERRIELALEGQRYFDIIRWRKGDLLAKDVKGTNVNWLSNKEDAAGLRTDDKGFIIVLNGNRFEEPKNYLWPIPLEQLQLNPELGQNPGW